MKVPKKCEGCHYHKVLTHSVQPYNYCTKLCTSFEGSESDEFLDCNKNTRSIENDD